MPTIRIAALPALQGCLQAFDQGGALDIAVIKQRLGLAVGRTLEAGHGRRVGAQGLQFFQQRWCSVA